MIDWPRPQLMSCVLTPGNRTLVTRRQFPSGEPACYFWQVNDVTIDGIIRSDNRGNETLFPQRRLDEDGKVVSNLTSQIREAAIESWGGLAKELEARNKLDDSLFDYIYGLFHTPSYRSDYCEALSTGYPRVVLTRDQTHVNRLIEAGRKLSKLHLADEIKQLAKTSEAVSIHDSGPEIDSPTFHSGTSEVVVADQSFEAVSTEDWQFRVGTHQVLRKWMQDRKGTPFSKITEMQYKLVIESVLQTRSTINQLSTVDMPQA